MGIINKDSDLEMRRGDGNMGICMRFVFLIVGICAFSCSIAGMMKCNFVLYEPRDPPSGVEDTRPDKFLNITIATIGLFRYDVNYEGCREITDDFEQLDAAFTAAQTGNIIAIILGGVALALILVDLVCCRFPCSRLLISFLYWFAFVGQAITFFVYIAPVCDPNYLNGPFPCSPDSGTWLSVAACVLFLFGALLICCVPKPIPLCVRVRQCLQDDETDGCCAICAKKPEGDQDHDEEKGAVVAAGGATVPGEAGNEEEEDEPTPEELEADQTKAAVASNLAAVRRGKQDEIEKQLELLTKYKDHLPEEEYDEKVTKLLHALPNPDTYDAFTKTDAILPVQEEEPSNVEEGENDDEGVEVGEEVEEKKSIGSKITTSVGSAATSVGSAMKGVKNAVTPGGNKSPPEGDTPASG